MRPNEPNHDDNMVRASESQRRGIASLRDRSVEAWVVKRNTPLSLTFRDTVFVYSNPSQKTNGLKIADAVCYLSAIAGNSSVIQAHHVTDLNSGGTPNVDYLAAPLTVKANSVASGVVYVNEADSGYRLHHRGNNLADMCDLMDAFRAGRINPPAWVEGKTHGSTALFNSFLPGHTNANFVVAASDELLEEAGLDDEGDYYMFTGPFLQSMPFASPRTVLKRKVVEATVENGHKGYSLMQLVYGVCAITGVTFTKTEGKQMQLVLHHLTYGKKHVLVGFIYDQINRGLGALGAYKSK